MVMLMIGHQVLCIEVDKHKLESIHLLKGELGSRFFQCFISKSL